ncbi:MAG: hypothetical protein US30_C0003G0055 [Candidatus Moranbacteria bacterium GW2011_GWF2_36_839]|nr:MAG: hypothetical protein US27_C0004G0055 [Candidatus Moranbacteria bacterium GW2011_GWF1_36_78]KKQ17488.1 MAG: hypothetical protein US30_C0003G0055 [Candidatus Moranbacteria bacterium GW2011_GWF2_36_839]HAT73955.1 hypothetical protein [Candidatus Moranbacteria bacterium]HBY10519.1 hypothetical protein [Candidatus Moranbacteria bacterium]
MEEKKDIIKEKVMQAIKSKKVKMRSHLVFMAEKLGLESALAGAIIFGSLLVSVIFYLLKKTGALKFLSLGIPGLKIFLLTLPYDYIALFIFFVILAIYFANQIELFCGKCTRTDSFAVYFFVGSLILGTIFGIIGVGDFLHSWSGKNIPRESAIYGKVKSFSQEEVLIEDENGKMIRVSIEKPQNAIIDKYEKDKFLRAIGSRDAKDNSLFHAQVVRCCDED